MRCAVLPPAAPCCRPLRRAGSLRRAAPRTPFRSPPPTSGHLRPPQRPGGPAARFWGRRVPSPAPAPRTPPQPAVRLIAGLRPPSTDSGTFCRPHPGDRGVVQIVSTAASVERPSDQLRWLWIRGRRISTDCGQRDDPQAVHRVVHRPPTGWGRLSPAIGRFSTCLSTVRQRDAPSHRVE